MTNTPIRETILFYEPNPWVRKGLRALIDPEPTHYQFAHSIREIDAVLKENEKQTNLNFAVKKKVKSVNLDGGIFMDYTPDDNLKVLN